MIRSMTGYGRAVETVEGMTVTVEIKSVNHRFFEFSPKVYRAYSFLEDKLKTYLQQYIARGKVDCFVQIETDADDESTVEINHSLAAGYMKAVQELCDKYGLERGNSVELLTSHPDIFTVRKTPADEEAVWNKVRPAVESAVKAFLAMRETEGQKLKEDVLSRADSILEAVSFIEARSPETVKLYKWRRRPCACAATSISCAPCSPPASPSGASWISSSRRSTGRRTPSAPRAPISKSPAR